MYHELTQPVEAAEDHVVTDPNQRKPARPVAAAEHVDPTYSRYETHEENPNDLVLKRFLCIEVRQVISQSDQTRRYEYETDDRHRERAFDHKLQCSAGTRPQAKSGRRFKAREVEPLWGDSTDTEI